MEIELEQRVSRSSLHAGNDHSGCVISGGDCHESHLQLSHEDAEESIHIEQQPLHPADTGLHAYLFLASGFILEALIWGFAFTFGVFQEYYTTHAPFSSHPSNIAIIGTCSMGVIYILSPIVFGLLLSFPKLKRYSSTFGLCIMAPALIISSFANTATDLLITQGIAYAIGASFAYAPLILFMEEWFVKRRGFAFGVMWVCNCYLPISL